MLKYSREFRSQMVGRMSGSGGRSANSLAQEVGVSQGTLSRWKRETSSVGAMSSKRKSSSSKGATSRRPKDRSAQDKLRLLNEASALSGEDLGAFLRREGIHDADLERWRDSSLEGLSGGLVAKSEVDRASKKVRKLEKELHRKEKALAEAAALLVLQKKLRAMWGDEEDDT